MGQPLAPAHHWQNLQPKAASSPGCWCWCCHKLALIFHLPPALSPSPSPHHPETNTCLRLYTLPHHILPTQPSPSRETSQRMRMTSLKEPTRRAASSYGLSLAFPAPILLYPSPNCPLRRPPSFPGTWEHSPAQDLDFTIFSRRIMMASKWETSPRMRKMFMVLRGLLWGGGTGALSAGREGEGGKFFSTEPRLNERSPSAQLSFLPEHGAFPSPNTKCRLPCPVAADAFPLPGWMFPLFTFPPRWILPLPDQGLSPSALG